MNIQNKLFAKLFKKFRLRAGFESLSSLGDVLADQNNIFDDSTLSRWQNGSRIPKSRDILIKLINIFADNNGITHIEEANSFMEVANQGFLTNKEVQNISKNNLLLSSPFQAPARLKHFVGRRKEVKLILKSLVNNKNVVSCISGLGGVGKTALAINLAYKLKPFFPDGILWSRMDVSNPADILNKIALTYKENVAGIKDLRTKAEIVRSLLFKKKALLIFDNVKNSQQLTLLLPNAPFCSVLITSRNKNIAKAIDAESFCLQSFSQKESCELFNKMIGFKTLSKKQVKRISEVLGYLPLALKIVASQVKNSPKWRIKSILKNLRNEQKQLDQLRLDNISVKSSFNLSFKSLNCVLKNAFISLAVFFGEDFSIEAVSAINKINKKTSEELLEKLINRCLIERSSGKRYRMHPLMKVFAQELIKNNKFHINACNYYISYLSKKKIDNKENHYFFKKELENILGLFKWCLKNQEYKLVLQIWDYLGVYLWDCGYWPEVYKLGKDTRRAAKITGDIKSQAHCCLKQLSWVCFWQNNIKKAEEFTNEGLALAESIKNEYLIAFAKKRLGMISKEKKAFKKAIKVLKEALEAFEKLKKKDNVLDILTYMGHIYCQQKDFEKATRYYKKALKIANEINDKMGQSIILNSLGNLYSDLKKFKIAENYYEKNFKAAKAAKSLPAIFWHKQSLGLLEFKRGNFEKAYNLLLEAYKKGRRLGLIGELKKLREIIKKLKKKVF